MSAVKPRRALRVAAWLRMVNLSSALRRAPSAVETADRATSMADARTALCLARGVAVEDIHPARGTDLSLRAYRSARGSWARLLAEQVTDWTVQGCRQARDHWAAVRPGYLADEPWPELPRECDTCGALEQDWPADHPLHVPGGSQCPHCTQADINEDQRHVRSADV